MKIAAFADIHANYIALQAIIKHIDRWEPDLVVVLGDIVNRGPRPYQCLELILERSYSQGWLLIRGNHEDYVIAQAHPDAPRQGPAYEVHRASIWTLEKLQHDVSALEELPFQHSLYDPGQHEIRFVHASMRGNRDGIYPDTSNQTLAMQIGRPPGLLCVGHTHIPLIRNLDGTLVVNVGSAGLPFDGDMRPCYSQLTYSEGLWRAKIVRLQYDIRNAVQDFYTSGYLEEAGPLAQLVLKELRESRSLLYYWASKYQKPALMGEISMQQSVDDFLAIM